jgi:hypothetical protein
MRPGVSELRSTRVRTRCDSQTTTGRVAEHADVVGPVVRDHPCDEIGRHRYDLRCCPTFGHQGVIGHHDGRPGVSSQSGVHEVVEDARLGGVRTAVQGHDVLRRRVGRLQRPHCHALEVAVLDVQTLGDESWRDTVGDDRDFDGGEVDYAAEGTQHRSKGFQPERDRFREERGPAGVERLEIVRVGRCDSDFLCG